MRELIRLLSSHLPVGKIPGIWEFIFPLLYNSSLSRALSLLLPHSATKSKSNHQSILYTCVALSLLLNTTCLLLFSFSTHSASSSVTFKPNPLLLLLYYIPLRLIRLHPSVIISSMRSFPSTILHPTRLSLFCFVSSTLTSCFFETPKWLLVTADCMTLTPLSPLLSSHLPHAYNFTLSPWRSRLLVQVMSQV